MMQQLPNDALVLIKDELITVFLCIQVFNGIVSMMERYGITHPQRSGCVGADFGAVAAIVSSSSFVCLFVWFVVGNDDCFAFLFIIVIIFGISQTQIFIGIFRRGGRFFGQS